MIHPARFLFNAGATPKQRNERMLQDTHLKVLYFEQDSSKVFSNTDIKGGVAITYHDYERDFGAIETFTVYKDLNDILHKVMADKDFVGFNTIVYGRNIYRFTDKLHSDYPNIINKLSKGHAYDLSSNVFEKIPEIFNDDSNDISNTIGIKKLEKEHDEILSLCSTDEEAEAANQEFEEKRKAAVEEVVRTVETQKKEQQKKGIEDSVKEFLRLRVKLANYFEENHLEDIFDYIPPQETDQIFTPKWVVKKMIDMLEQENPGCFDMPDKTFIDLYMKSGLYIAEIVKRLYQIDKMKREYPDGTERLRHIFREQVYGLAPTEIIYKIATNFILGFEDIVTITEHNFRQADALEYAKQGTLEQFLDELYGGDNNG